MVREGILDLSQSPRLSLDPWFLPLCSPSPLLLPLTARRLAGINIEQVTSAIREAVHREKSRRIDPRTGLPLRG